MRYRTIVADPPWPITWSSGRTTAGAATGSTRSYTKRPLPYATSSIEQIAAIPVEGVADDDAHLFMWTLDRFLIDGSAALICRAWGFEPLPQLIVWRKTNAGLGRYIRPAHETILVGRRGAARLREVSTVSVHDWRQTYINWSKVHSAKPEGSLDLIESLSEGPYLELFARRNRLGWDTWGDQSLEHVAIEGAA